MFKINVFNLIVPLFTLERISQARAGAVYQIHVWCSWFCFATTSMMKSRAPLQGDGEGTVINSMGRGGHAEPGI